MIPRRGRVNRDAALRQSRDTRHRRGKKLLYQIRVKSECMDTSEETGLSERQRVYRFLEGYRCANG
jgi:hypothetical protein